MLQYEISASRVQKLNKCDSRGVSLLSVWIMQRAQRNVFAHIMNKLISDEAEVSGLVLSGYVQAKTRGPIWPSKTRLIVPTLSCLQLVDYALALEFDAFLLEHSKRVPEWWLEGAVKGVQVMDVSFRITMCIEKGLDNAHDCSICGADIQQYFDNLDHLKVARYLLNMV